VLLASCTLNIASLSCTAQRSVEKRSSIYKRTTATIIFSAKFNFHILKNQKHFSLLLTVSSVSACCSAWLFSERLVLPCERTGQWILPTKPGVQQTLSPSHISSQFASGSERSLLLHLGWQVRAGCSPCRKCCAWVILTSFFPPKSSDDL